MRSSSSVFWLAIAAFFALANPLWADDTGPGACRDKASCALQSVVSVLPLLPANVASGAEPEGSGIVVGNGRIVATANHVLGPAKRVMVRTSRGDVMAAKILLRDLPTDLALLEIDIALPALPLAESTDIGNPVCAIGNSFGLDLSLTCGVISALQVSGVGFNPVEDFVQTDAAVNPGMSGGALVDSTGAMIGLLSAIFTKKSDSNIGVNFAVSAQLLQTVLSSYQQYGRVVRVQPGLLVRPSLFPGETGTMGARVVRVENDRAEARAGLKVDDIVLSVGGRRIKRAGAYRAALALLPKGTTVPVTILRDNVQQTVSVRYN